MDTEWIIYPIVEKDFPLFIRAGYIVPFHNSQDSITAEQSRLTELTVKIALSCIDSTNCFANGSLKITNKLSLELSADVNALYISLNTDGLTDGDLSEFCGTGAKMTGKIYDFHLYGHPKIDDSIRKYVVDVDFCNDLHTEFSFDL